MRICATDATQAQAGIQTMDSSQSVRAAQTGNMEGGVKRRRTGEGGEEQKAGSMWCTVPRQPASQRDINDDHVLSH